MNLVFLNVPQLLVFADCDSLVGRIPDRSKINQNVPGTRRPRNQGWPSRNTRRDSISADRSETVSDKRRSWDPVR